MSESVATAAEANHWKHNAATAYICIWAIAALAIILSIIAASFQSRPNSTIAHPVTSETTLVARPES